MERSLLETLISILNELSVEVLHDPKLTNFASLELLKNLLWHLQYRLKCHVLAFQYLISKHIIACKDYYRHLMAFSWWKWTMLKPRTRLTGGDRTSFDSTSWLDARWPVVGSRSQLQDHEIRSSDSMQPKRIWVSMCAIACIRSEGKKQLKNKSSLS